MKKKHELIKEAYDRYPKGTIARFKDAPNTDHISDGIFKILDINHDGTVGIYSGAGLNCFYLSHDEDGKVINEWAEIIPAEPEKTGLLNGKCAIQVNNEREFKLLMEHYDAKGWKWAMGQTPLDVVFPDLTTTVSSCVTYKDRFSFFSGEYKIIPFADFAQEIGIKVPIFVMKSEDGVDLYEGDFFYAARKENDVFILDYHLEPQKTDGDQNKFRMGKYIGGAIDKRFVFSTKEAAFEWIEEMNKPKELSKRIE